VHKYTYLLTYLLIYESGDIKSIFKQQKTIDNSAANVTETSNRNVEIYQKKVIGTYANIHTWHVKYTAIERGWKTAIPVNPVNTAAINTRRRLAIIYVSFTVDPRDASNTCTIIAIDMISACAIVLTWVRLTLVDIH